MSAYRVIAIPDKVATIVRSTRRSPGYGHPVHAEIATAYGPCRLCLRTFQVGTDSRLLFTYDPFHGQEPFPLPGPVFIHESPCDRHAEDAGFPVDLIPHRLTLNAYGRGRRLAAVEYVTAGNPDTAIEALLARPDVDYIHVRDTDAGCYDCRIERSGANSLPGSP
jgi:hypothetical protein